MFSRSFKHNRNFSSWTLANNGYNPKPPSNKNALFFMLVVGGLYAMNQSKK